MYDKERESIDGFCMLSYVYVVHYILSNIPAGLHEDASMHHIYFVHLFIQYSALQKHMNFCFRFAYLYRFLFFFFLRGSSRFKTESKWNELDGLLKKEKSTAYSDFLPTTIKTNE